MTAVIEDTDVLAGLEFDPPCEHSKHPTGMWGHSGPAWAVVQVLPCPHCHDNPGIGSLVNMCQGSWEDAAHEPPFVCAACRGHMTREQALRFLCLIERTAP